MGFGFENLEVYKKAIDFANKIYKITKDFPANELYGITFQIRRASISVSSNICRRKRQIP